MVEERKQNNKGATMKATIKNQKGFTLIELILAIAILGILAVSVGPAFGNLIQNSSKTGGLGTAEAIQSAINTKYSENLFNNALTSSGTFWPDQLDNAAVGQCGSANPCFDLVAQPVTHYFWSKTGTYEYTYVSGGVNQVYTYDTTSGRLSCTSGC